MREAVVRRITERDQRSHYRLEDVPSVSGLHPLVVTSPTNRLCHQEFVKEAVPLHRHNRHRPQGDIQSRCIYPGHGTLGKWGYF